jgi:hypothetical protein
VVSRTGPGMRAEAGVSATGLAVTLLGLVVAAILAVGVAWPWWSARRAAGPAGQAAAPGAPSAVTDVPVPPASEPPAPTTTTGAAGASRPLVPDRLVASASAPAGIDASGQRITYEAGNLADGREETAWRVAGSGVGVILRAEWDAPVTLTSIALLPGYAKVDPTDGSERFWQNRRVLAVRYHFDDGTAVDAGFIESPTLQRTAVAVTTRTVTVEIARTSPPQDRDYTAISELAFEGASG